MLHRRADAVCTALAVASCLVSPLSPLAAQSPTATAAPSVEGRQSRVGTYAKRGAIVGAIGGGVMGVMFLDGFCSGSTTCTTGTDVYIVGGGVVAGALAGSLIGALTGWAVGDRVRVEAATRDASPVPFRSGAVARDRTPPSLTISLRVPLAH